MVQEILHPLHRSVIIAAPQAERSLLNAPLPHAPCQRMVIPEILRTHAHQQCRIGILAVSGVITHAVDHQAPQLRCRRNHFTARTHAEGISAPAVRRSCRQLIRRGSQCRMIGKSSVLAPIDHGLRMFNSHANGKRLLHHGHTLPEKVLQSVSGTVADSQQHGVC